MRITEPLPNWRSIWVRAAANAFLRSSSIVASYDACVGTSRRHENCAGGIIPYLAALAESPLLDARSHARYAVATTFEQAEIAHLPDYRLDLFRRRGPGRAARQTDVRLKVAPCVARAGQAGNQFEQFRRRLGGAQPGDAWTLEIAQAIQPELERRHADRRRLAAQAGDFVARQQAVKGQRHVQTIDRDAPAVAFP